MPADVAGPVDVPPLRVGHVEEAGVGGLEEGDAKGQPDAHDPKFDHLGHEGAVDVGEGRHEPVAVEEEDGGEGEGQAADPQHRIVAPKPEEGHGGAEDDGPDDGEDYVEDGDAIETQLSLGVGRVSQLGAHGGRPAAGAGAWSRLEAMGVVAPLALPPPSLQASGSSPCWWALGIWKGGWLAGEPIPMLERVESGEGKRRLRENEGV